MKRREFITLIGGAAAWPIISASAQDSTQQIIGVLHSASADPSSAYWSAMETFRQGLRDKGFVEGQSLAIQYRWAENRFERLATLASDLVQRNVSVIFAAGGDVAALAAKKAASTIPIVFAIGADPVKQGIVSSLSGPEGNVTGVTFLSVEIRPKMLELIRDLSRVGASGKPGAVQSRRS